MTGNSSRLTDERTRPVDRQHSGAGARTRPIRRSCQISVIAMLVVLSGSTARHEAAVHAPFVFTPVPIDDPTHDGPTHQHRTAFGHAVAAVGDLNGDGVTDLLIGAPQRDVGGTWSQGQAFAFSGADRRLLYTLNDPAPSPGPWYQGGHFGRAVAGVGDIDDDGVPDLLVGAPWHDVAGNTHAGQAFTFSGADGRLLYAITSPHLHDGAFFGEAVAGVGDLDGDDVPDLLVGAPGQGGGGNGRPGQAFTFSGVDGRLLYTLDNPSRQTQVYGNFGGTVAGAGDVTGDGIQDFLVAASTQDVGVHRVLGQAFVFDGSSGRLLHTLNHPSPQSGAFFGIAVAAAGDVTGDGVPDFLVGARGRKVGHDFKHGEAFVFDGTNGRLLYTLEIPARVREWRSVFDVSVAGIGDVTGDGIPELVVGAPFWDAAGESTRGQVFLFSGRDGRLVHSIEVAHAVFGLAVAGAGDINGDGRLDFLVGAPGDGYDGRTYILVSSLPRSVDVYADGKVDCIDMEIVLASFGKRTGQWRFDAWADIDRSGVIDVVDLAMVARELPSGTVCR